LNIQKFKVIKKLQHEIEMYLTGISIAQLRKLQKSKQLFVDVYNPEKVKGNEGYQRGIDEQRAEENSKRLKTHGKFSLFAFRDCKNDREMENFEMALFHLIKHKYRKNKNHPPPVDNYLYCS